jgi:hypothetical protein
MRSETVGRFIEGEGEKVANEIIKAWTTRQLQQA